jgi:hypothetical protein
MSEGGATLLAKSRDEPDGRGQAKEILPAIIAGYVRQLSTSYPALTIAATAKMHRHFGRGMGRCSGFLPRPACFEMPLITEKCAGTFGNISRMAEEVADFSEKCLDSEVDCSSRCLWARRTCDPEQDAFSLNRLPLDYH